MAFREHRDIDSEGIGTQSELAAKEFLKNFYRIVHEGATFETAPYNQVQVRLIVRILQQLYFCC